MGSDDNGASFAADMLRATQLLGLGCFREAEAALDSAQRKAAGDDERATAAIVRANLRFWHLADPAGAHRVLDAAAAGLTDRRCADDLAVQQAALLLFGGQTACALARCREVRSRCCASPSAQTLGFAVELLGRGLQGETGPLDPPGHPADDGALAFQDALVSLATSVTRAVNGLDAETVDGTDPPSSACDSTVSVSKGIRLLWAGRPRRAIASLEQSVSLLQHHDQGRLLPVALGEMAYARALIGDADGAEVAADDADRASHPCARIAEFSVGRGHAWTAAARGELTVARERTVATAEACERLEQPVLAAQAWYDLARLGAPALAAGPLARLAGSIPDTGRPAALIPRLAAHVGALAVGDARAVGRASIDAHRRGHLLHAAEAAAQVATLRGPHRRVERDRWAATARELAERCEGAHTPPLGRVHDLDLTPREQEVVGLVARGLTNRDIARRLDLSVRTVANHLQASYDKLDVHRREDLARMVPFGPD